MNDNQHHQHQHQQHLQPEPYSSSTKTFNRRKPSRPNLRQAHSSSSTQPNQLGHVQHNQSCLWVDSIQSNSSLRTKYEYYYDHPQPMTPSTNPRPRAKSFFDHHQNPSIQSRAPSTTINTTSKPPPSTTKTPPTPPINPLSRRDQPEGELQQQHLSSPFNHQPTHLNLSSSPAQSIISNKSSTASFRSTTSHLSQPSSSLSPSFTPSILTPSCSSIYSSSSSSSSHSSSTSPNTAQTSQTIFSFNSPDSTITDQSSHRSEPVSPILDRFEKRRRAIQELIDTEYIYSSDLAVIRDIYLLRSSGFPPNPPPISSSDRQIIFSNISQLSALAQSLSEELLKAHPHNQIGSCFITFLPSIEKQFTVYCSKYDAAHKRLLQITRTAQHKDKKSEKLSSLNHHYYSKKLNQDYDRISRYLKDCQALCDGKTCAWDLGSLLIKPVQRCLKYSLLIDQIIKYTEADDSDLLNLLNARDGMVRVAESINESKRRHEIMGEVISRPMGTKYAMKLVVQRNLESKWDSPTELLDWIDQVKRSSKALKRLIIELKKSDRSINHWILSGDRLVEAFKSVYLLKSNDRTTITSDTNPVDFSHLNRYQHLVLRGSLDGPFKYLHERIQSTIIPQVEELIKLYSKPIKLIEKYEKRKQLVMMNKNHNQQDHSRVIRRPRSEDASPPISPISTKTIKNGLTSSTSSSSSLSNHQITSITSTITLSPLMMNPSTPQIGGGTAGGGEESLIVEELKQIESFLMDQLPKFIHLSNSTFRSFILLLTHSFRSFQSDLILLYRHHYLLQKSS